MTDSACKPLAAYLDERRAAGLVDIKFYVHNAPEASVGSACIEAETLFAAREKAEKFTFNDRRPT